MNDELHIVVVAVGRNLRFVGRSSTKVVVCCGNVNHTHTGGEFATKINKDLLNT